MLEVAPSEEGGGENKGATASPKEALEEGRIKNPSLQGEKRTASENPEAKASKRGKKSAPEGPVPGRASAALSPQRNQPSSEPSVKRGDFVIGDTPTLLLRVTEVFTL